MKEKDDLIAELELTKKARLRDREARLKADQLLEEKTRELYLANQELTKKYEELQSHSGELELFLSLSKLSQGIQELNEVLQFFVDAICKLEKWPVGHVFLLKKGNDKVLVSSGIWHFDNDRDYSELYKITSEMTFKIGEQLPGITLATEEPIYIEDVQNEPNYMRSKVCEHLGIHSTLGIPLKCNNKVLAVVEFFILEPKSQYQKGLELILSFLRQLEILLERREAQEEARESNIKLQQALFDVQEMAHHDSLTNLPNRRQFELTLKREIASAKRYNQRIALLCIDIDNFKSINDHLGHDVGDLLLIEVGNRLRNSLRAEDFVARLGGDEFAIILQKCDIKKAEEVTVKLLSLLNKPCEIEKHEIITSVSIGIACFPETGSDYITLYKNSDLAMYNAKERGKNTYQYFDITLRGQYKKRLDIENNLELALGRDELFLVYQPIYDLQTQQIFGIEVLLRWEHPEYGLISPDEFIPIAEEKGTIIPLGKWILQKACEQYTEWRRELNLNCKLLINISPRQLKDEIFLESALKTINETHMPFDLLEFEITETALMSNPEIGEEILKKLSDLGIKIAIDDFGTGYSSLNRLKALPISSLKIDKSFIQDIGTKDNNDMIIKLIISLANELNLQTIAEGVEEKSQLNFLLKNKCPEAQGFFFHQPLKKEEMRKVFIENKNHFY